MTKEAVAIRSGKKMVIGTRPVHKHLCAAGEHEYDCNSPYCADRETDCPDHEGPAPIVQGYEPWRR